MGFAAQWAGVARHLTRTLGETQAHPGRGENVLLRRAGSLEDVAHDASPSKLVLLADADLGATSLTLGLEGGTKLKGALPVGARLVLASATYLLTAPAETVGVGATSIEVEIAPGLVAAADEGAEVQLSPDSLFTLTDCHVTRKQRRDLGRELQEDVLATISVPVDGQPVTPRLNDSLELEDGTIGRCSNLPITTGAIWKLQMGA